MTLVRVVVVTDCEGLEQVDKVVGVHLKGLEIVETHFVLSGIEVVEVEIVT